MITNELFDFVNGHDFNIGISFFVQISLKGCVIRSHDSQNTFAFQHLFVTGNLQSP